MSNDTWDIREINFVGYQRRILKANARGKCALLAISNVLILRAQLNLPEGRTNIELNVLVHLLKQVLFRVNPVIGDGRREIPFDPFNETCVSSLPRLCEPMEVNVRFDNINGFAYSTALLLSYFFNISLVHGWIPLRNFENQAWTHLDFKTLEGLPDGAKEKVASEPFLKETRNAQLTKLGIERISRELVKREPIMLYCKGQFFTIVRIGQRALFLNTDAAADETNCWQRVVLGDSNAVFYNEAFKRLTECCSSDDDEEPGDQPKMRSNSMVSNVSNASLASNCSNCGAAVVEAARGSFSNHADIVPCLNPSISGGKKEGPIVEKAKEKPKLLDTKGPSAAHPKKQMMRAPCPKCKALNEVPLAAVVQCECGKCHARFRVAAPAGTKLTKQCSHCKMINQYEAPATMSKNAPIVWCGNCGKRT